MKNTINGETKLIGIIANPIQHSMSPLIHNSAFELLNLNYVYLAFNVDTKDLKKAINSIKALNMRGCNVSMPYKNSVIPYLDRLSTVSKIVESVNTIVNNQGILTGYTTDGIGLINAIKSKGYSLDQKKIIIIGCGGAGKAILAQLAFENIKEIIVYQRKSKTFQQAKEIIKRIKKETTCTIYLKDLQDLDQLKQDMLSSDILINTTNVGMEGTSQSTLIPDTSFFHPNLFVVDIIYHPQTTPLLTLAAKAGCKYMNGMKMLLYQGAESFYLWTNQQMPVLKIEKIIESRFL